MKLPRASVLHTFPAALICSVWASQNIPSSQACLLVRSFPALRASRWCPARVHHALSQTAGMPVCEAGTCPPGKNHILPLTLGLSALLRTELGRYTASGKRL